MSKMLTDEEVRENFLRYLWDLIDYWVEENRTPGTREKIAGAIFSTLVALDGDAMALPGFVVAPAPHPDDAKYCQDNGENWYPRAEARHDIAGGLHEEFDKYDPKGKNE